MSASDRSSAFGPPGAPGGGGRVTTRYWVEYKGHKIELRSGVTLIGRSAVCQIVLDDGLVSRRHAQIKVEGSRAELEDFGSVNGVFLNGKRLKQSRPLSDGDVIRVGKQEMTLRSAEVKVLDSATGRFNAETLHGDAAARLFSGAETGENPIVKHTAESLQVLGGLADKAFALGRGSDAERVLSSPLKSMLEVAKNGALEAEVADKCAAYSVRLADTTRSGKWVDYVIEMFTYQRRPLPGDVVDQLYTVLRNVSEINLSALRKYVALLHAIQNTLGPRERFVVQRIEGLEQIAVL